MNINCQPRPAHEAETRSATHSILSPKEITQFILLLQGKGSKLKRSRYIPKGGHERQGVKECVRIALQMAAKLQSYSAVNARNRVGPKRESSRKRERERGGGRERELVVRKSTAAQQMYAHLQESVYAFCAKNGSIDPCCFVVVVEFCLPTSRRLELGKKATRFNKSVKQFVTQKRQPLSR